VPTWRGWGGAPTASSSSAGEKAAGAGEGRDTSAEELSLWDDPHASTTPFEERPLCSMALKGSCPRGDACPYLHGEVCVPPPPPRYAIFVRSSKALLLTIHKTPWARVSAGAEGDGWGY